jgi:hypothetical protein
MTVLAWIAFCVVCVAVIFGGCYAESCGIVVTKVVAIDYERTAPYLEEIAGIAAVPIMIALIRG